MSELTNNVNWVAVIVGFIAAYGLGFLWYGLLFRKPWAEGHGLGAPPDRQPVGAMVLQAVGTFLLAWLFGITAGQEHLLTIIMVVLCIAAFLGANALFTLKSGKVVAIEGGYIIAMGIVLFLSQAIF